MWSEVSAVQISSAGESVEAPPLFQIMFQDTRLRELMGYDPKKKDGSHVDGIIMSCSRLDVCAATVSCCLVEWEKRGQHREKDYGATYLKVVKTCTRLIITNVTEFVKNLSWDDCRIKEDGLRSAEGRDAVMGMSRSSSNVCTLPYVKRKFISVEETWLWTYLIDALGSVTDYYI